MFFKKTRAKIKDKARQHKENLTAPAKELARRYKNIQEQSRREPPRDFDELLNLWNLTKNEVPIIRRQLRWRCAIFILIMVVFGGLLLGQGYIIAPLFIVIPSLVGIMTTIWRMYILANQRYISFRQWFFMRSGGEIKEKVSASAPAEADTEINTPDFSETRPKSDEQL